MTIDDKVVNNIRLLSCAMISNAKSGHSGIALGAAPILYSLYSKQMNVLPKEPNSFLRDRFVLSAGHGSSLLYATLYTLGFPITKAQLMNFRQPDGLPGHPELNEKLGVDCSTGPLGQGVATAVGMAIGQKMLEARYNKPNAKVIDSKVYTLVGEGCLMEGVTFEALSLAGNLKLNNLIVIYDCNKISLDSSTTKTFNIDVGLYMKSLGFSVIEVANGNNLTQINNAIAQAKKSSTPAFIIVNTQIGYLSDYQNSHKAHGSVLSSQQLSALKTKLKINTTDNFQLEKEVQLQLEITKARFSFIQDTFSTKLKEYKRLYPEEYAHLISFVNGTFAVNYKKMFDTSLINNSLSSREMGGIILNQFAKMDNSIVGGSADVSSSTRAYINDDDAISPSNFLPRNILYGVREFAMSSISAGLALCGFKPFASTFLVFSDYMKSSIRLNAMMGLPVSYILTHDSVMVGEDGPTHQPVEQVESLRLIPGLNVFRPCSFNECLEAFSHAFTKGKPNAIILSRQNLNVPEGVQDKDISRGGYIISPEQKGKLNAIIIATGSEVSLAIQSQKQLLGKKINVRVVSMLSEEVFQMQPLKYQKTVLPSRVPAVAVEAGSSKGWYKYAQAVVGVDNYGESIKGQLLFDKFNITAENITRTVLSLV